MNDINNVPMSAVPVDVYRNLHKNTWSIKSRTTGLVIRRADNVIVKNATFVVQPGGRQRVLDEERKNVHAFVRGTLSPISTDMLTLVEFNVQIKYNPYILEPDQRAGHFYEVETEETIGEAPIVVLDTKGAWIQGDGPKGLSEGLEEVQGSIREDGSVVMSPTTERKFKTLGKALAKQARKDGFKI